MLQRFLGANPLLRSILQELSQQINKKGLLLARNLFKQAFATQVQVPSYPLGTEARAGSMGRRCDEQAL